MAGERPGGTPSGQGDEDLPRVHVRVPDDARDLARDLEALRRERRAAQRRGRLAGLLLTRRDGRAGPTTLLVVGVLLVVAVPAALLALLTPRLGQPDTPAPLAQPAAAPGTVGGLLPDVPLVTRNGAVSARSLNRPGVLALVPRDCGCDEAIGTALDQSREFTSAVRLVVDGSGRGVSDAQQELERLRREPGRGIALGAVDPAGVLHRAYAARGTAPTLTLVLVRADGTVPDVVRDVRAGERYEARLSALRQ